MNVYILNTSFEKVAVVDTYQSLIWTKRYYEPGDFELYIPADVSLLQYLKQDYYVIRDDDERVMIIEKIEIKTDAENGDYFIVTGRSLESILARRIIWTQFNWSGTNTNVVTMIYNLLSQNVISPDNLSTYRKIPNFTAETPPLTKTATINLQRRGDTLQEFITEIAKEFGIGWKITLSGSTMKFAMFEGSESIATFSYEYDNLLNTDYVNDKTNYKNAALILGEGEGTARKSQYITPTATGLNRREVYIDARDISSNDGEITSAEYYQKLKQRGVDKMTEFVASETFEGEIEPSTTFLYKKDYNLGDIVTVKNQYGIEAHPRIVEIIENFDDTGYKVVPAFETWEV